LSLKLLSSTFWLPRGVLEIAENTGVRSAYHANIYGVLRAIEIVAADNWNKLLWCYDIFKKLRPLSSSFSLVSRCFLFIYPPRRGDLRSIFLLKITPLTRFLFPFYWNKWFFTSTLFFLPWFRRLSATLFCSLSLCNIVCLSCFIHVFVWFKFSYQINAFGVLNVAYPETWLFWRLKYSHMCRL